MQKNDFKETKIDLGTAKGFAVSAKAKYVPADYSAFCPTGCGWVRVDTQGRCRVCKAVIIKEYTYEAVAKRFQTIIDHNITATDLSALQQDNIKLPVKIGHAYYFVPLKYFVQFSNMLNHDMYPAFFENIKQICHQAKL